MGLGVTNFVSVGHIFAILSSHNTFTPRPRILKHQSRRLGESPIYHSPPLLYNCFANSDQICIFHFSLGCPPLQSLTELLVALRYVLGTLPVRSLSGSS